MIVAAILSNDYWTFWDVMLFLFVWIPLLMVWFFCLFDVFTRHDLSGVGKAVWLVAILVLPWIGAIAYLIFRPWGEDTQYRPVYTADGNSAGTTQPTATGSPGGEVPVS
jgi:hypothetical protein